MSLNWCRACNSFVECILMRKILAITLRLKCISSPFIIFAVTTFRSIPMRHVANRERRMQFSFTSLVISNYFAPTHKLEISKDCMNSIHFLFCAFWKASNAFWCGGALERVEKCKLQQTKKTSERWKMPEKQKYLRGLNGFSRDNEWVSQHMCVRPQKSFLSYTLFTGASRARLSRGPLYLYVLWLEIMHGGVLA